LNGDFCDLVEHQREHEAGEERLDDIPERTENGLLVARDKVAVDKAGDEVAVFPEFAPRDMEDAAVRRDHGGPMPEGNGLP
jgi:hypothetical protein